MKIVSAEEFLKNEILIDVRSPKEYEEGHIPGAINIPLFDDDERARVGLRYKQSGQESAVLHGLEIVGPKMAGFIKTLRKFTKSKKIGIHCWRGGMRSQNMAWLFGTMSYEVEVLEGGYKAYRSFIRQQFANKAHIVILGGMTGSGKTDILHQMQSHGVQILDLEGHAHHKGSAFGAFGQKAQPTSEQFENNLYVDWQKFDLSKPIWIEDESRSIGAVSIPETLWLQMRKAEVVKLNMTPEIRLPRLVKEYADFPKERIASALTRIQKRLGGQHLKRAMQALDEGDFYQVAAISLNYYDKAYLKGLSKRDEITIHEVEIKQDNPELNAVLVQEFYDAMTEVEVLRSE